MKNVILILISMILSQTVNATTVSSKANKVLVVLSSQNKITLRDGVVHPTGFFLSELMVPVKALIEAGFTPVFANPNGNEPTMDKVSDSAFWFGGDKAAYEEVRHDFQNLKGFKNPLTLKQVRAQGLKQYVGIFVPGGHAPMEDLLTDNDLGAILRYFHEANEPTALICHGPIALLSTLSDSPEFVRVLAEHSRLVALGQFVQAQGLDGQLAELSKNWIYRGYEMTAFSTKEEQQEELSGQDKVLGGFVQFYPDEALSAAGGATVVNALKWQPDVRQDRELITGQNPFSDVKLAQVLLQALKKQ